MLPAQAAIFERMQTPRAPYAQRAIRIEDCANDGLTKRKTDLFSLCKSVDNGVWPLSWQKTLGKRIALSNNVDNAI